MHARARAHTHTIFPQVYSHWVYLETGRVAARIHVQHAHPKSQSQQPSQLTADAEVLLDIHARSEGRAGYGLGCFTPSPDFSHYAFTECQVCVCVRARAHMCGWLGGMHKPASINYVFMLHGVPGGLGYGHVRVWGGSIALCVCPQSHQCFINV